MLSRLRFSAIEGLLNSLQPSQRREIITKEVVKCQKLVDELTKQRLEQATNPEEKQPEKSSETIREAHKEVETLLHRIQTLETDKVAAKDKLQRLSEDNKNIHLEHEVVKRQLMEAHSTISNLQKAFSKQNEEPKEKTRVNENSESKHEIFGNLISDFGFKKVYASDPKLLCDPAVLPIWEKQRFYNAKRAKDIARSKQQDNRFGYPGVITAVEEQQDGKSIAAVIDGQHRLGSLRFLIESGNWDSQPVLTEVYSVESRKESESLFREINKSQPVKEIDLPGQAKENDIEAINGACSKLENEFGNMFSTSQRCRLPHVNIDNLRQTIFDCQTAMKVLNASKEEDAATNLLKWILEKNETLSSRTDKDWEVVHKKKHAKSSKKAFEKALQKAKQNNFYLGLDDDWASH